MLEDDYFSDNRTHVPNSFRRCFQMNKELFMKILQGVQEYMSIVSARKTALS
jgi:hypothetical protein